MKFWNLRDLELFFDRSKQGVWILRKDPTFPAAIVVQGRQMFDSAEIKAWDVARKKAADDKVKRQRAIALSEIKAGVR